MSDDVENRVSGSFSYYTWKDHLKLIITKKHKVFLSYLSASFIASFGALEILEYFLPSIEIPKLASLTLCLSLAISLATFQSIHQHFNETPPSLEGETKKAQKIAIYRRPFWEFELAHQLIRTRITETDSQIDNLLNNRIYVPITRAMNSTEYIDWVRTRPENLVNMVEIAKQLLIFDLISSIQHCSTSLDRLVNTSNLISDLYKAALDFHKSGKSISFPEHFNTIHEIQAEWVSVIQDGTRQTLCILKKISERNIEDTTPIEATIIFEEPPRINEFSDELEHLESRIYEIIAAEQ